MDGQKGVLDGVLGLVGVEDAPARDRAQQRQAFAQQPVIGARVAGLRRGHQPFPARLAVARHECLVAVRAQSRRAAEVGETPHARKADGRAHRGAGARAWRRRSAAMA